MDAAPESSQLADLMAAYCAGDAAAFRALYAQLGPRIRGYLQRLCREPALADDLLQATFLRVHRARHAYVAGADPVPWVYAIAHRLFVDEMRRRKRRPESPEELAAEHVAEGSDADPRAQLVQRTESQRAVNALAGLPEDQRQAVMLTKLEGLSMQSAAEIAGTTVAAMKVRAHRGYLALRRALEDV